MECTVCAGSCTPLSQQKECDSREYNCNNIIIWYNIGLYLAGKEKVGEN